MEENRSMEGTNVIVACASAYCIQYNTIRPMKNNFRRSYVSPVVSLPNKCWSYAEEARDGGNIE